MLKRLLRSISLFLGALLLALGVSAAVNFIALFAHAAVSKSAPDHFNYFSIEDFSDELTHTPGGYALTQQGEAALATYNLWAILLDEHGDVVWSAHQPADVPSHYTLAEVAGFTRWYLAEYPVRVWAKDDGLLVTGAPKGTVWKYNAAYQRAELLLLPLTFLLILIATLLFGRRSFRNEAARRNTARSRWIDGISHDIRTPLSLMMGYAGDMAADETLPAERRTQAAAMVNACTGVKTLVADLNLTMRLDYEMQPLRREEVSPAALLREVAAELLNSGLAAETALELTLAPGAEQICINADPVLLRRALMNLFQNALRHGGGDAPNRQITATLAPARRGGAVFTITNPCAGDAAALLPDLNATKTRPGIARDGSAAHGTGLRLVQQIAKAHHGKLRFTADAAGALTVTFTLPHGRGIV